MVKPNSWCGLLAGTALWYLKGLWKGVWSSAETGTEHYFWIQSRKVRKTKHHEKGQKEWRKTTCKYVGGTWEGCQGCFLQGFFTAVIDWQGEVTFAMRWLGLGLCLMGRLGRGCSSFPRDCRGGQWSSILASAVRHESKPLPSLLTPSIFSKEAKMSLQCVDVIGTCLLWVSPGSSHPGCILLHCTTLWKIRAPSCIVTMLCKASEYATLRDVPAPRTSFRYFRYDNDPFKVLIKIEWVSYLPQL